MARAIALMARTALGLSATPCHGSCHAEDRTPAFLLTAGNVTGPACSTDAQLGAAALTGFLYCRIEPFLDKAAPAAPPARRQRRALARQQAARTWHTRFCGRDEGNRRPQPRSWRTSQPEPGTPSGAPRINHQDRKCTQNTRGGYGDDAPIRAGDNDCLRYSEAHSPRPGSSPPRSTGAGSSAPALPVIGELWGESRSWCRRG